MGKYTECKNGTVRFKTLFAKLEVSHLNYAEHTAHQ